MRLEPQKAEIVTPATGGRGLGLVAGFRPVGWPNPPVGRTFRLPGKSRFALKSLEHGPRIIADVGRNAKLGTGLHDARQEVEER